MRHPRAPQRDTALLTLLLLLIGCAPLLAQVEIRYLGNEGFLLSDGQHRVLIDALFGDGLKGYPTVPAKLRRQIESAQGDFAAIDLVLASHVHGDHFDAAAVAEHLRTNARAHFISTPQAIEALRASGIPERRSTALWPAVEAPAIYGDGDSVTGPVVTAMHFHHGASEAQNLGLMIELGGLRILHLGDTSADLDDLEKMPFDGRRPDIVLLPYWILESASQRRMLDALGAEHWIVMHFPAADAPANYFGRHRDLAGQIAASRALAPRAWLAHRAGEARRYGDD